MTELETMEIATVGGGVTADRWGRGCTDPRNGQEPKREDFQRELVPEIEIF